MKLEHIPKFAGSYLKSIAGRTKVPVKVSHHVTYRCNLKCAFCRRRNDRASELSFGKIKPIMDEFREMGTIMWTFNGGEPLLHNEIGELIDYSKHLGFYTALITNGLLVKDKIESVRKVDHVDISLDGTEAVNDKLRGQGVYAKVLETLEALKRGNISTTLMTVLTKYNCHEVDGIIDIAREYRCTVKFQPVAIHPQDKDKSTKKLFPASRDLVDAMRLIRQRKREGGPIVSSGAFLEIMEAYWPGPPKPFNCAAGTFFCDITPEGNVSPCCQTLSQIEISPVPGSGHPYGEALKNMPDMRACTNCFSSAPMELSHLFNLSPQAIKDMFVSIFIKKYL